MSVTAKTSDFWDIVARENLTTFLHVLERADEQGVLDTPESFSKVLSFGLSQLKLNPADMALEEEISKAAVSRWLNSKAIPPAPTRKHIIGWLKAKAEAQLGHHP